jgi:hypothetical protein
MRTLLVALVLALVPACGGLAVDPSDAGTPADADGPWWCRDNAATGGRACYDNAGGRARADCEADPSRGDATCYPAACDGPRCAPLAVPAAP